MDLPEPGAIADILETIASGDISQTLDGIDLLEFDSLERNELYILIGTLLDQAVHSTPTDVRTEMIRAVINAFEESNPTHGTQNAVGTYTHLFFWPQISIDTMRGIAAALENVTHDEVVADLMRYDDVDDVRNALKRLTLVYGERSYIEAELLYRQAEDEDKTQIARFYYDVMREQSPFSDTPAWVIPGDATHKQLIARADKLIKSKKVPMERPSDAELAEQLTAGLSSQGVDIGQIEIAREVTRAFLASATPEQANQLLEPLGQIRQRALEGEENIELRRLLGPVNLLTDAQLLGDDICARFGGCRMLTCNCFERDRSRDGISFVAFDPDGEPTEKEIESADWFMRKSCHTCGNRVRSRSDCVRRALPQGGWQGLYCTKDPNDPLKCARESLSERDLLNGVSLVLLSNMLGQLQKYGLYGRRAETRPFDEVDTPGAREQTAELEWGTKGRLEKEAREVVHPTYKKAISNRELYNQVIEQTFGETIQDVDATPSWL